MAEIINLRRARKAKARDAKEKAAAANRALFGRPTDQRAKEAQEAERTARVLDDARLDPEAPPQDDER